MKKLYRELRWRIKFFFRFIKKIFEYSYHILWHDEDWDLNYIIILLIYKLKRTRELMSHSDYHKEEVKNILEVETLLQSVLDNDCKNLKQSKQDLKIAFNIMHEHMFNWWD